MDGSFETDIGVEVRYSFRAGTPEYIPSLAHPEQYDPGSPPEIEDVTITFMGYTFSATDDMVDALKGDIDADIQASMD